MVLNKNKTRKAVVACYATEWDVKHPTILRMAYIANIIPKEQFQQMLQVDNQIDIEISPEQISLILENYFGFEGGEYEEHLVEGSQVNKIGGERIENLVVLSDMEKVLLLLGANVPKLIEYILSPVLAAFLPIAT